MGAQQSNLDKLEVGDFRRDYITFLVNGKEYNVKTVGCDPEIGPEYLLVDYLRDKIGLTGTKYMCREGGCGSCMVSIKSTDPITGGAHVRSANSCLLPLFACDGLEITTVEGLGNRKTGYTPMQERLIDFGGSQCGFCTPGFVMTMNSIMQSNPQFTTDDVEYSFDSNICRCTGYRPIIEAFKSLATNPSEELKLKCLDIEDSHKCPLSATQKAKNIKKVDECEKPEILNVPRNLYLEATSGQQWFKVTQLDTLFEIIQKFVSAQSTYRIVVGNTGTGFYRDGPYQGFIEVSDIPELQYIAFDRSGLVIGGGVTITTAIDLFDKAAQTGGFVYAKEFTGVMRRVANLSVRNRASLAGNLMVKHDHREFPSDLFTLFESVGATLTIGSSPTLTRQYTLMEFLELDMTGKVILAVHFPKYDENYVYKCYKLGRRHQSATAFVNAGFLLNIDPRSFIILERPRICYGGIGPDFVHANATEKYLQGKVINQATLQDALGILHGEAVPDTRPTYGSPQFRLSLAQAFLYRFFLSLRQASVSSRLQSGAEGIIRQSHFGKQIYDTDRKKWPLNQPVRKIEGIVQSSGEAEYINDIPKQVGELFGVFVVSDVTNATIRSIDASQALMMPGVVAFITAKDVPGRNNVAPFYQNMEEIFADTRIRYAGQAVGLLVAEDKYTAFGARGSVVVHYENITRPTIDIRDAVKMKESSSYSEEMPDLSFPCRGIDSKLAKEIVKNVRKKTEEELDEEIEEAVGTLRIVKGQFYLHPQYHFHMETQVCLCVPNEDGMDVYSSTQQMDSVHVAITACLSVPRNSITVHVRRLGGAFGAKISKATHIACAAAVASHVTSRPVRVAMDLGSNMHVIGKRLPYLVKYEATVDGNGKIYKLNSDVWCDPGCVANEVTSLYGMVCMQSCYRAKGWSINPKVAQTDTAVNTYCRSPGSAQGVAIIENIMHHIAHTVKKDPLEVRQINFIRRGDPFIGVPGAKLPLDNLLPGMIAELKINGDYESRRKFVDQFNKNNRWKKRGLAIVPHRYPNYYNSVLFPVFITVYASDGTVDVSHGGIEMGQGLNTKVAQVVAHTLQIPLERVKVKPSNTIMSPNAATTGGSVGSELVCDSARRACKILLEKLAPLRKQLGTPTWEQLIAAAQLNEILLTAQYQIRHGETVSYDIWGISMLEVEVDVLTGDFKSIRADIINDAGEALSPMVDIGQCEGAFIMGLGWWTTEELIYDNETGLLLTDSTRNYMPPMPSDVPEDFRTTLLRNAPNPYGVLSSKATGEAPFNTSCVVLFALRNAIDSARQEVGNYDWYELDGAVTRDVIRRACLTSPDQFTM